MKTGIVFAGVGGQGVLTASSIIGIAALKSGINVVMSEVHGMAQRGGIVVTEMNIGDAQSPLVGDGEADIIVGFEPVEAYRILHKAHKGSDVIVNTEPIVPITVSLGSEKYPNVDNLIASMEGVNVYPLEATEIARKIGNVITMNIVIVGALSSLPSFPIEEKYVRMAIEERFPPKYRDINLRAFEEGKKATGKL